MVTAYSMLDNGGKRVKATLIDRIQDRWGHTIYKHDERICQNCDAAHWDNQDEPKLVDTREQVIDPLTAYQITSIMEGVIQRGTGIAIKEVGKHLAGKTGTTNDAKDAWFAGFTPNLLTVVWTGFDQKEVLGLTGAQASLPAWVAFMKAATAPRPALDFTAPPGIVQEQIDPTTGYKATPYCPVTMMGVYPEGMAPSQDCPYHTSPTSLTRHRGRPARWSERRSDSPIP